MGLGGVVGSSASDVAVVEQSDSTAEASLGFGSLGRAPAVVHSSPGNRRAIPKLVQFGQQVRRHGGAVGEVGQRER